MQQHSFIFFFFFYHRTKILCELVWKVLRETWHMRDNSTGKDRLPEVRYCFWPFTKSDVRVGIRTRPGHPEWTAFIDILAINLYIDTKLTVLNVLRVKRQQRVDYEKGWNFYFTLLKNIYHLNTHIWHKFISHNYIYATSIEPFKRITNIMVLF